MLSIQKAPKGTYDNLNSALIQGSRKLDLTCEEVLDGEPTLQENKVRQCKKLI